MQTNLKVTLAKVDQYNPSLKQENSVIMFAKLLFESTEELDIEESSYTDPLNSQTNLLTVRNVELSNSFKSLEIDTDSSRGSRESLESVESSVLDEQEGREEGKVLVAVNSA